MFLVTVLSFYILNIKADDLIDLKCQEYEANVSVQNLKCSEVEMSNENPYLDTLKESENITEDLQQWLWLTDKISKILNEDENKLKQLDVLNEIFDSANKGYEKGQGDPFEKFKFVQDYFHQEELLYETYREEEFINQALNTCYSAKGFFCTQEKMDDFKQTLKELESKRISIQMLYPLLSHVDIQKDLSQQAKDGLNKTKDELTKERYQRASTFPTKMLEIGIDIKEKLIDKIGKWKNFSHKNDEFKSKKITTRKKSRSNATKSDFEELQYDNSALIEEIFLRENLENDLSNPFLGTSICHLYKENSKNKKTHQLNQNYLNAAIFVAPFFLGPVGVGARLAVVAKVARLEKYGHYIAVGGIEAGLLTSDVNEMSKQSEICNDLNTQMYFSQNVFTQEEWKEKQEQFQSCQEELEDQIYFSAVGIALAPLGLVRPILKRYKLSKKEIKQLKEEASQLKITNISDEKIQETLEKKIVKKSKSTCRNQSLIKTSSIRPKADRGRSKTHQLNDEFESAKAVSDSIKRQNEILNSIR